MCSDEQVYTKRFLQKRQSDTCTIPASTDTTRRWYGVYISPPPPPSCAICLRIVFARSAYMQLEGRQRLTDVSINRLRIVDTEPKPLRGDYGQSNRHSGCLSSDPFLNFSHQKLHAVSSTGLKLAFFLIDTSIRSRLTTSSCKKLDLFESRWSSLMVSFLEKHALSQILL